LACGQGSCTRQIAQSQLGPTASRWRRSKGSDPYLHTRCSACSHGGGAWPCSPSEPLSARTAVDSALCPEHAFINHTRSLSLLRVQIRRLNFPSGNSHSIVGDSPALPPGTLVSVKRHCVSRKKLLKKYFRQSSPPSHLLHTVPAGLRGNTDCIPRLCYDLLRCTHRARRTSRGCRRPSDPQWALPVPLLVPCRAAGLVSCVSASGATKPHHLSQQFFQSLKSKTRSQQRDFFPQQRKERN